MPTSSTAGPAAGRSEAHDESEITKTPPAIPVEQIIAKFSQHESEFRKERDNYTYSQSFVIQTVDFDGNCPCGRKGIYFLNSIGRLSEALGGDDKITCAKTPQAYEKLEQFALSTGF